MQRKGVTYEHLAGIVDCLLVASSRLAPEATVEEAASALLSAVADRLLDTAVGARISRAGGAGHIIVARSPRGLFGEGPIEARLFPEYALERVAVMEADEGSTLHLATDGEAQLAEFDVLVDRLALALGGALRRCRAFERMRAEAMEVHALQAQIIHSEKLASVGKLAAGVVHELNNPLTSIIAYSDFLQKKARKAGGDAADIERLARIQEAAERILRFSRDLIDYTRPSTERHAALTLREVIERALVFCEHVLDDASVTVDKDFGEVRKVRGVAGQLTQVFVNLFTNAAHAMRGRGGTLGIALSMAPNGEEVTVAIRDEGHGIEAEHLALIFEPFFTTKTDGSGTGLGLSIVREIIQRHGGRVRAESSAARGTVFTIDLPALGLDEG